MQYESLILQPLGEILTRIMHFVPTLFISLIILVIGCLVAHLITRLMREILIAIKFDKMAYAIGLTHILENGGVKGKPSKVVYSFIYILLNVIVLYITVKALGLSILSGLIDSLMIYIPNVLAGVMILILGMLLANFISRLVYIAANSTSMPNPPILAQLTKLAILVYVGVMYLKEVGFDSLFVGLNYTIFISGIILALALAFGLAGQSMANRYLDMISLKKVAQK